MTEQSISVVNTDNEMIDSKTGVYCYTGGVSSDLDKIRKELWLPEQAFGLVDSISKYGGVTLIGHIGAGKSAILYGARAVMRARGTPYVQINGHYKNIGSDKVIDVIDSAEAQGMTIFYDSADYLTAAHAKVRTLELSTHLDRNKAIMNHLIDFRQKDGNLVLTSHHEGWHNDRAHPDLIPTWIKLLDHTVQTELSIMLETFEDRTLLLRKMGLTPAVADFISGLSDNPDFLNHILNTRTSKEYITWAVDKLHSYQILKLFVKDTFDENGPVIDVIERTIAGDQSQSREACWDSVLDFIYSKTYRLVFYTKL